MVKIYYSDISEILLDNKIIESLPLLRRDYVKSFKDQKRKKQSVFVWKLLECVLKRYYSVDDFSSSYQVNGLWGIRNADFNFSLTHSDNIIAVAISEKMVGVDVEKCSEKILKLKKKLSSHFNNEAEIDALTLEWTKKESLFKAKIGNNFFYKKIVDLNKSEYYLTACSDEDSFEIIPIQAVLL